MNTFLLVGALAAIYLTIYDVLRQAPLPQFITSYVIPPIVWGLLVWLVSRLPRQKLGGKLKEQSTFLGLAVMAGFVQVVAYVIGGLFSKLGKNPASFTPLGITVNVVLLATSLLGTETSRAWLINRWGQRRPALAMALVSLIFTVLAIPLGEITEMKMEMESISHINSVWLPLLTENLLASMLARLAGARASLAYRGTMAAFWWFCPIVPGLPWALRSIIGASVPIFGLLVANSLHAIESNRGKPRRFAREAAFPAGMIVTAVFSMGIVWFAAGLMPLKPSSIASGSMRPLYEIGDVVVVAKVPASTVKLGDVVEYRKQEGAQVISIVHRVIEINDKTGVKTFVTKGDANGAPDAEPVLPANVVGKVVFHIPKVGLLSLLMKRSFTG